MSHDNHSQLLTKILQFMYLDKCTNGIDIIQPRYNLRIIPTTITEYVTQLLVISAQAQPPQQLSFIHCQTLLSVK